MSVRKFLCVALLASLAWAEASQVSHAQFFGRRGGYYGGRGYYGGYGTGYGSGWDYGSGYYNNGVYLGVGRGYGNGYYNNGYYNNGYYTSTSPSYSPMVTGSSTNSYQAFYPSGGSSYGDCSPSSAPMPPMNPPSNQPAPAGTTTTTNETFQSTGFNDGRGVVVINVPANAEIFWNGTRSTAFGAQRRFTTGVLSNEGISQKFEARWQGPDGRMMTRTREVRVQPNQLVTIDFNRPDGSEESSTDGQTPRNPNQPNNTGANPGTNPNIQNPTNPNIQNPTNPNPLPNNPPTNPIRPTDERK